MPTPVYTPRQVAKALGVSESSVKRWVDSGKLPAAKTVGGHRKVSLPSLTTFIRETGHQLVEPELIGLANNSKRASLEDAREELHGILIDGSEGACRELIQGLYLRGETIADLGDRLIGPVFTRLGDEWASGVVSVGQERRACEVMMAALLELRRSVEPAEEKAPLAVVATPEQDFAVVANRLVELVLVNHGWRVWVAGSGLPLPEIRDLVMRDEPRLLCLSATHLMRPEAFIEDFNATIARPVVAAFAARDGAERPRLMLGGFALSDADASRIECDLCATRLADLVAYQAQLR
ncbi:Helix-turn-helix domain protein [Planctomycetes bacterium MalM25]|nr:Helix-turn-helix domain protein [Planctomycetes bacterium MalM25]